MPYQDFVKRLQGQQQPLTLPEYDLPTQIEPVVDPHQAAVEKIFGRTRPNFAIDAPDDWNVEEQKPATTGKPPKYRKLSDLLPKKQKTRAAKPAKRTGTESGTVTARNPLIGSAFDSRPRANNEFDLSLGGPTEAEQMVDRAIREAKNPSFLLEKREADKAQVASENRLERGNVARMGNGAPSSRNPVYKEKSFEERQRVAELQRMRKQVESENFLTRFGRRFLTTAAGGLKPDEEFINAPVGRGEDAVNSVLDSATRGLSSIPEGFGRIADYVMNADTLEATKGLAQMAKDPNLTPEERANIQARIRQLHGSLSKVGDYVEPISKAGDAAAKGLYPRDPNAEETINPLKADFWSHTMPGAAGSMLPFMAAGGVGNALKLAPELVAGGVGMAMEVPDQYHEARAAGATPEQLSRSVEAGMVAGGLESLGAESLMGKVGMTGKSVGGHVVKEAVQEFGQEGAQSLVEDLGAKYYAKTKPELTAGQITMNALQNAVPALFLGAGGGVLSAGGRNQGQKPDMQQAAQQIEELAVTQPENPIVQVIASVGIDPAVVSKADPAAVEELSVRLQSIAEVETQIEQLQGEYGVAQQQLLNVQDAQRMGRVPSQVDQQASQTLPVVEQQIAVAEEQKAAIVEDLAQNVSPLFKNLAKAIGKSDVQPLGDVADDKQADLLSEVRKAGGISAAEGTVEKGELDRLGIKELGTTGLIRREGGQSPDRMREQMADEGLTQAETPQQFIEELENTGRREKTEAESYRDYQRSQMTEEEAADSDRLDSLLEDRSNAFTKVYRALDNPNTILSPKLMKEFDREAIKAGFSDDFIERSLVEFQQQRGIGIDETSSRSFAGEGVEPGRSMKPSQPGIAPSLSPYKVLEANKKDLLKRLYDINLNSAEAKAGINEMRDWARTNNIAQKHVDAHLVEIMTWQKKYGVPKNPDVQPSVTRKAPQPARSETAPVSSSGFSQEQRQLLGRDPASLLDSEFDEYMGQLENLQNLSVRGQQFGGFDVNAAESKSLVTKLIETRSERKKRVKAKRLPALTAPHTKKTDTKAELGEQLVEQAAKRGTIDVPRETANVSQVELIDQQAHEAATSPLNDLPEPTKPQIEAGNYKKGHIFVQGLDVTIENPKGSKRSGQDRNGKKWEVEMSAHYGYIRRTVGADEEQIDVYVGGNPESGKVFVVDQVEPKTGKFDEHKVVLGVNSQAEAEKLYDAHFSDNSGAKRRSAVTEMSVDGFKKWLKTEDNTKPVSEKSQTQGSETANNRAEVEKPVELISLPKKNSTKRIEGVVHVLDSVERIGELDFELWESGVDGGMTMITRDAVSGEVLPGSIISDTNAVRAKRRFADKTKEARESSKETAAAEPGLLGDSVGKAAVESGAVSNRDAETAAPGARSETRADVIANQLIKGTDFSSIQAIRKQFGVQGGTEAAKKLEEDVELAGVLAARQIVGKGLSAKETYAAILDLHGRMPNLNTRTSESVRDQAYSTPLPIAYVASRLAGVTKNKTVYEPTGGNGALIIEANPENTTVDDLNPQRVENLRAQGFEANVADATKVSLGAKVDIVLANPPFGVVKENGQSKQFETPFGKTTEIDHAIAFQALEAMASNGRAVLIVGGVNRLATTRQARSDAYNAAAKRRFYSNLYDNYNVVDHFTIDGRMYAKQGAAWPVDVIVIDGKGKSARQYPAVSVPEIVRSYDELSSKIPEGKVLESEGQSETQLGKRPAPESGRLPGFDESADSSDVKPGRRSGTGKDGRTEQAGSGVRKPGVSGTRDVVGQSGDQSTSVAKSESESTKQTGSSVPGEAVREDKPAPVGERVDSGTGRASKLDSIFEEELADMFGETQKTQPTTSREKYDDALSDFRKESAAFSAAQKQYRGNVIDDDAYWAARDRFNAAEKVMDEAEQVFKSTSKSESKATKLNLKQSADALMDLFGEPAKVGPPASRQEQGFDQSTYNKAKPLFESAVSSFEGLDDRAAIRSLFNYFKENYGERAEAAIIRMKPYIIRFVEERATSEQVLDKKPAKIEQKNVISEKSESSYAAYEPLSKASSLNVAVPKNMAGAVKLALDNFEDRHGSPDVYVAEKLGYKPEEVEKYFSAEQVDALALAVDNIEQGKGFIIGDQCVAAGTKIFDPLTNTHTAIEVLAERNQPIVVLALTGTGLLPVFASAPFRKGEAELYRVVLDDGRKITVTAHHRFLTPDGWSSIGAGLHVGHFLASAEGRPACNLEFSPSVHVEDAQHLTKKPQDCLGGYYRDGYQYDGLLQSEEGIGQVFLPLQADALGRNQILLQKGDQVAEVEYSHQHQSFDRLSRSNSFPLGSRDLSSISVQAFAYGELLLERTRQNALRFPELKVWLRQLSASVSPRLQEQTETGLLQRGNDVSSSLGDYTGWRRIESIEFIGVEAFYDLWVPGHENYVAEGLIHHNTGIGKGRINAGIIRYAIKNGKTPVFVTQKPALYADMIRDLKDIGMENVRPLITNSGEAIPLNDVATEWMHAVADAKANGQKAPSMPKDAKIFRAKPDHVATLEQVGISGKLKGYDVVFTAYDQMNPMGGLFSKERHAAVSSAVRGGVLIMDESHTAGAVAVETRGKPTPRRSRFFRGLVNAAGSVFYSSATYAKRPDLMDLYSKTDLGLLGQTGGALTELFARGGVALQQVVASKLAEAGQYLRRERTFDGITYSPEVVEVSKNHAENVSTAMRKIVGFDQAKRDAVRDLKEEVKAEAALASEDGSIGRAGVDSSNFTSLMHNVIDQMLLGLKADQAAAQAIKAIQNGERPVLTVSNTMESFLKNAGLSPGDAVDLTFKDVLMRYLIRSRDITIKDRDGNKTRRPLTDDELGPKGMRAYEEVEDFIVNSDFGEIPISPIDRVRELIEKAGYKVDEITGRGTRVDSTGKIPILRARSAQDTKVAGRRRVIGDFNNGRIDVLILNQAGSTGISLHASPAGGKDTKPRHMIIWQAEKNIDTHMQMLGRVNRTGQVTLPRYTQMIADVPAEKRPAAVLLKKMASLSANTTASRKSAVQTEGVTDFINELGDEVVARMLTQDAELSTKLGDPLEWDGTELSKEGAAHKVSGRIPLLTLAEQQEVYERIESEYADFLAQKEAMGENPLEARTEDFRAETLTREILTEGIPGSPFSEPAFIEKMKIRRTVKPYTSAEVSHMVRENLGLADDASESDVRQAAGAKVARSLNENRELYETYKKNLTEGIPADDVKAMAAALGQSQKASTVANHWGAVVRVAQPGAMVSITKHGFISGVVLDVVKRGKPKNPYSLGSWVVRLAVLDGRELRLSFNELIDNDGKLEIGHSPEVSRFNPETGMFESRPMLPEFDASQGTKKQTRYMVTGNIVSGYAKLPKGQILNYTDVDGNVKQGVLLPSNFDAAKTLAEMPVQLSTASQVLDFLDLVPRGNVSDAKQELTIQPSRYGTDLEIRVLSSKAIGGKFYLDKELTAITGNFVKQGGLMKANIDRAKLPAVMEWLKEQGTALQASHKDEAKTILAKGRTAPPASRRESVFKPGQSTGKNVYDVSLDIYNLKTGENRTRTVKVSAENRPEAQQRAIEQVSRSYPSSQYTVKAFDTEKERGNDRYTQLRDFRLSMRKGKQTATEAINKMTTSALREEIKAAVEVARNDGETDIADALLNASYIAYKADRGKRIVEILGTNDDAVSYLEGELGDALRLIPSLADKPVTERKALPGQSRTAPPASRRSREDVESSPEFKKWFGKSKVVDASGKPKPVYHGTQSPVEIKEVKPEKFDPDGHYGPGFYTTESSDVAAGEGGYATTKGHRERVESEGKPHAYKLYLNIQKPFDIEGQVTAEDATRILKASEANRSIRSSRTIEEPMTGKALYQMILKEGGEWNKSAVSKALQKAGYDGITHLGGKLQGSTKSFGFNEAEAKAYADQVGGTVSRDSDTGEYEVADHRVWIAFEPNQVKSYFNRGTFDETANLSTSRRKEGGPASQLANPMDTLLYQQTIIKSRGSRGARMYVNDHARAILGASLTEVFGDDYSNVNAINLSREEVKKVADYLETESKGLEGDYKTGAERFVADLRELLGQDKKQRTFNIVDVTAYESRQQSGIRSDRERAVEEFKGDIREEGFHWSQREVSGQSVALVGASWAQSSKGYGKYRRKLLELGYPDDPETLAAETAAKIAADKFDDLGIRTEADHEQAQNWLASYFERVAERHGVEALDKFNRLLPKAKEAKEKGELSVKERLRQRIEEDQAKAGGANRPRAPGSESGRVRAVDEGESEDGAQEVRGESSNAKATAQKTDSGQGGVGKPPPGGPSDGWSAPFEREPEQLAMFDEKGLPRKDWGSFWQNVSDVVNIPKAMRASADLSAMLRQGFYLTVSPSRWAKAARSAKASVKALVSTKQFDQFYKNLKKHPAYKDAIAAGLYFSGNNPLSSTEEQFGSRFAGKIPWAKYSEQAFKVYLDSIRIETFALYHKTANRQIKGTAERFESHQAAAGWINVSSGKGDYRGRFGSWYQEKAAPLLNVFGWAPGLVYSRFQMINPLTYAKNVKNAQHRVVFVKQMSELFQTAAVLTATGALALASGATISFDPDDADFLKLRFGTTRYDVLAGVQQVARLAIQLGEWVKSRAVETDEKKLKKVSNETTMKILRFGRTKLAPVPAFFVDWLNDWRKITGEVHRPGAFWGKAKEGEYALSAAELAQDPVFSQVMPLIFSSTVEAYVKGYTADENQKSAVNGLIRAGLITPFEFVGLGVQDYDRPEYSKTTRQTLAEYELDPGFPDRKPEEDERTYQKRVKAHIREQERVVNRFASDPNMIGQPKERANILLRSEISKDGIERLSKLKDEDIEDDRMVRAWIQVGVERMKADPVFQQMSEMEQKHAIQSYYGRMNKYKAQPKNSKHGYQSPDYVDENILQRKIKEAIKAQQGN